jgi:hypothetical protein
VVKHPIGDGAIEISVRHGQLLRVADESLYALRVRRLDHARGDIHGDDVGADLTFDARSEFT